MTHPQSAGRDATKPASASETAPGTPDPASPPEPPVSAHSRTHGVPSSTADPPPGQQPSITYVGDLDFDQAQQVDCPTCGALAGWLCNWSPFRAWLPHPARIEAAEESPPA